MTIIMLEWFLRQVIVSSLLSSLLDLLIDFLVDGLLLLELILPRLAGACAPMSRWAPVGGHHASTLSIANELSRFRS